uniref:Uncharacterized protein n=1 Tax=uncultured Thiotrichaceae bacterium TaxID=298394 RepID=A0A6S6TTH7_9GAMM|nr:MAG: Unknown protein [uncultured Thiotrichaceae bacterium]
MNIFSKFILITFLISFFSVIFAEEESKNNELVEVVERLCYAPPDGKSNYYKVLGEGEAGIKVKFIGKIAGEALFTQEEWDGVQKVLKEDVAEDRSNYRACVRHLTPIFLGVQDKKNITLEKNDANNSQQKCYAEDIDYKNDNNVKQSIKCLDKKSEDMDFDLGDNKQKKEGITVKFNGCEPIDNHKSVYCYLVIKSEYNSKITLYNDQSQFTPTYFDEELDSRGANYMYVKRNETRNNTYEYQMIKGVPVKITYRHANTKNKITAYFFNIGMNGKTYNFKLPHD